MTSSLPSASNTVSATVRERLVLDTDREVPAEATGCSIDYRDASGHQRAKERRKETNPQQDRGVIVRADSDRRRELNATTLRLMHRLSRESRSRQRFERDKDRCSVDGHVLAHVQMNSQGIGEQRQCSGGGDLDLVGKLSLIVLIASSLDRFP